jgi:TRAP transporter TAXI family solute receptor
LKKRLDYSLSKINQALTKELLHRLIPIVLLVFASFVIAYQLIDAAPPKKIVISMSDQAVNDKAYASIYQALLKNDGITLEIRETSGDLENIALLKDPHSGVDLAFVQDGITRSEGAGSLQSLGSLYYEPVWVLCRCDRSIEHLAKFKGKRIAIGNQGEGANLLAVKLLEESGLNKGNTKLLNIGGESSVEALMNQSVDAAILVDSINSTLVEKALSQKGIRLVDLDDAEAYTKRFSYLHHLKLPEGTIDIKRNIPPSNINLVSPTVTLIAREELHPAITYLMMKVITQVHHGEGLLNANNEFPSIKTSEVTPNTQALNFYKSGTPFLDKYLPFWAATMVSRTAIVLIPLLAILIPLIRLIPAAYNWFLKFRLFKYYGELRFLEMQIKQEVDIEDWSFFDKKLDDIEDRVGGMKLPISFSQYIYELRINIDFVRSQLRQKRSA